jgi:hypothetical protein
MTSLTQEQINWLDKCAKGCTLNLQTGLVDVFGDFICSFQGLSDFKGVKFGKVTGDFLCDNNSLASLVGAPQKVRGSFSCTNNQLTSLVGAPHKVKGLFHCDGNRLTSLVGAPLKVGSEFSCSNNQLISLVGAPQSVGRGFWCDRNRLASLEGATLNVHLGKFWCDVNPVSAKTLVTIFDKMKEGDSFLSAAASLRNEMSEEEWKLIAPHIPEAIRPGVSMLGRFGLFN